MAGVAGRSGSGGVRPNSGAKPKAITKRSNAAAQKLAADDAITPLEVMVLTMREIWGDGQKAIDTKLQACAIAEKCAPYLHPRLASTEVKGDLNATIKGASTEDLRAELKSIIAEIGAE
jgi:hypothetical protein